MNLSTGQYWDQSWSPIRGCSHASPGCLNCWAERMAGRFCRSVDDIPAVKVGQTHDPFHGFATKDGWTGRVELIGSELVKPLHWKKPRVVALNWMGDLFHEKVPFEDIMRVVRIMQQAYWHKYLILTKRSKRLLEFTRWMAGADDISTAEWPRQCALGVSCEDQERAEERIPELLRTPAAMRFVSLEPILGAVDLEAFLSEGELVCDECGNPQANMGRNVACENCGVRMPEGRQVGLDWVIVGGESGPGARPMHPDWVRSVRDQCQAAGVPFFFKQWGENIPESQFLSLLGGLREAVSDGRRFKVDGEPWLRVGKSAAGCLLDGRTWDGLPDFLSTHNGSKVSGVTPVNIDIQ